MGEHYCESCDRGWPTSEELEEHLATHVKCEYEECQFVAHPKVVAVHIKLQHLSGLFDKMKSAHTSEEIQKWREERKRHYPTQKNIEEKLAAAREREERGERLIDDDSKFKGNRSRRGNEDQQRRTPGDNTKKGRKIDRFKQRHRRTVYIPSDQNSFQRDIVMEEAKQVMKNLVIKEDDATVNAEEDFSDEEWNGSDRDVSSSETNVPTKSPSTPQVCSVLAALSAAYDSDSDDAYENSSSTIDTTRNLDDSKFDADDEHPEQGSCKIPVNTPNYHVKTDEEMNKIRERATIRNRKILEKQNKRENRLATATRATIRKTWKRSTLLEKLLAGEIRQERNNILQCVRFIINNSYFEDNKMVNDSKAENGPSADLE